MLSHQNRFLTFQAVIKGLGLSTLAAITGEGAIRLDPETHEYTLKLPADWVTRLAPELAENIPCEPDASIIPKVERFESMFLHFFSWFTQKRVTFSPLACYGPS